MLPGNRGRTTKDRICLKCGVKFYSVSPANRICGGCNKENERLKEIPIIKSKGER